MIKLDTFVSSEYYLNDFLLLLVV